jgi:hypothetical protein
MTDFDSGVTSLNLSPKAKQANSARMLAAEFLGKCEKSGLKIYTVVRMIKEQK